MPLKTFLRVGAYYQSISGKALSTDLEITEIVNNGNPLEPFINDESAGGGAVPIPATAYASNAAAVAVLGIGVLYKSTTLINNSPIILITV